MDYSWRRFQIMVGDDYGIRWLPTYVEADAPRPRQIANFPPINRMLTAAEHPFPLDNVLLYDTMYVETGRYLRQMTRDVHDRRRQDRGSAICLARRHRGAAGDAGLQLHGPRCARAVRRPRASARPRPARSAAAAAGSPLATTGGPGYMFPRPDGIMLGGTFERDVWDDGRRSPRPSIASSRRIGASSRASAAPLEAAGSAPDIVLRNELSYIHSPERRGQHRNAEGQAHTQGDRRRPQRAYRRAGRREARRRRGPAQPLAPPAALAQSCATRSRRRTS